MYRGTCFAHPLLSSSVGREATAQDAALYADRHVYAATALRENGISVVAFDSMLEEPSAEFAEMLAEHRPRIVAVYEDDFNFLSKMCLTRMREVAWEIAKAAQAIGAVTVVHGSDSTDNPALFLQNGFDYVLCGEAEEALVRLCQSILNAEEGRRSMGW